ncbi:hypothetical protein NDU88_006501 [Pleurodeles waltl]|uniref:Uncharacterized protein n=1 Tax=Pleurodeles waltl TaxID=8319 RepID=A0AAV7LS71_PLEWA|nr:hypothetical protein NDU88_006501 [Pleurodeles waltl]
MSAPPTDGSMDKLDVILQEIRESRQAIEQKLGSFTSELSILKDDNKKLADRLKQMESNVKDILRAHKEYKNAIEQLH